MSSASVLSAPASFHSLGVLAELPASDGRHYFVSLPATAHIVLVFGQPLGCAAASFQHPNLLARQGVVHEFKHYRKDGGKFWTSRSGVNLYLAVPTDQILLVPERGYSFVRVEINGVRVHLNVCGGTHDGGWTDHVASEAHCAVGHSVKDIARIVEVAATYEQLRAAGRYWTDRPEVAFTAPTTKAARDFPADHPNCPHSADSAPKSRQPGVNGRECVDSRQP